MITWLESDIEDYLVNNLQEVFGDHYKFISRQVNIGVGIVDILMFDMTTDSLVVVEVKKDSVKEADVAQVMRYVQGVKDYLGESEDFNKYGVRGILAAPGITDAAASSLRMIQSCVEFCELFISLNIELHNNNYTRNKDSSTYKPKEFLELVSDKLHEIEGEECG